METMVMKAGKASVISLKSISVMHLVISTPTMTRALVVAAEGMIRNRGEKKRAMKNKRATVNEVMPVLPPSMTPVVLST